MIDSQSNGEQSSSTSSSHVCEMLSTVTFLFDILSSSYPNIGSLTISVHMATGGKYKFRQIIKQAVNDT